MVDFLSITPGFNKIDKNQFKIVPLYREKIQHFALKEKKSCNDPYCHQVFLALV